MRQINNSTKYCRECNCELILGDNWAKYNKANYNYICNSCNIKQINEWKKVHPNRVKISNRKYVESENGKLNNKINCKIYSQSKKGKLAKSRADKKYSQTDKGKLAIKRRIDRRKGYGSIFLF